MRKGYQSRRQWGAPNPPEIQIHQEEEPVDEVAERHEEYLLLLQEKNRVLKKLKKKDPRQVELEQKEQGFSLYLNGANQGAQRPKKHRSTRHKSQRPGKSKTAEESHSDRDRALTHRELNRLEAEEIGKLRSKTAPEKVNRKTWCNSSLQIKTARGEKVRVKPPELLTGDYEDDFEVDESSENFHENSSQSDYSDDSYYSQSETDSGNEEIEEEDMEKLMKIRGAKDKDLHKEAKRYDRYRGHQHDEDKGDQMLLSVKDVKKLRQSLEMNASIRQSMANQEDSDSDDSERDSPIPEEEEFDDSTEGDDDEKEPNVRPNDMIVLEFAPSEKKVQGERQLSAKRRSDPASFGALRGGRGGTPRGSTPRGNTPQGGGNPRELPREPRSLLSPREEKRERTHTPQGERTRMKKSKELVLKPQNLSKKQSRPLSANRRTQGDRVDSNQETEAVLAAMRAENEDLERQRKSSRSAPGRSQHEDESPVHYSRDQENDRPSSAALSWRERLKPTDRSDTTPDWPSSGKLRAAELALDGNLDQIVQKVLQLDTRGQRKLLKALSQIEDADISNENSPNATIEDKSSKKTRKPMKATAAMTKMVKKKAVSSDMMEVSVQLLDNWGHESRVGLTEIQFYDMSRAKIAVDPSDVIVHGARDQSGDISAIFSGRFKTVKDKHMWCCQYSKKRPVEISLVIRNSGTLPDFGISKFKMWNYNKSLSELSVGARHIKVYMDGSLVYDGEIEKGCGNQVFDYGQTIPLGGEEEEEEGRANGTDPALKINLESHDNGDVHTPNIDKVDLFRSVDTDRPGTRLLTDAEQSKKRPEVREVKASVESKPKSRAKTPSRSSSDKPKDSTGEPKAHRQKKQKQKKSKMAANLSGSGAVEERSSVSNSVSQSVSQSQGGNDDSDPASYSYEESQSYRSTGREDPGPGQHTDGGPGRPDPGKARLAIPDHLTKPASPAHSDDESVCMLQQIRKQLNDNVSSNVKPAWLNSQNRQDSALDKKKTYGVPSWLDAKDINSPLPPPPESRDQQRDADDDILDNWPKQGSSHLPTVLDNRPQSGRRSSRGKTPQADTREDRAPSPDDLELELQELGLDMKEELTPMQQIESARNQWRKAEEFKLEESWTNLNLFDRSQKGRISLDLEKDVLDEYLPSEKGKPTEPTISEEPTEETVTDDEDEFTIPELPGGREMVINIHSTWGDRHYVGLNGVEIFTNTGEMAEVSKITADPLDINVLAEYNKDPRVVANLVDGVNRTRDDTHMWLAPYSKGKKHLIYITFAKPVKIAMMRIWNYNKSRIHSYRGAKDIEVSLDGQFIFKGEIARACGGIMGGSEAFGDTILFTMEEDILERVSQYDQAFEADMVAEADDEEDCERPKTADTDQPAQRPFTSAAHVVRQPVPKLNLQPAQATMESGTLVLKGRNLVLNFTATWGDPYYLGLTGLEVVGKEGEPLAVTLDMLDADPRDLHVLPGYERDDRTLDKVIDGENITMSDEHMWLIPFTEGESHQLNVQFTSPMEMTGLRFWNYNKSPEDTYRGAKTVHVQLDGRQVSPSEGFLIRKGPGNCCFDFAQEVSFTEPMTPRVTKTEHSGKKPSQSLILDEPSMEYEALQKPCGFIYQFHLLSTWGDPYYVGLNGIEFFDTDGNKIELTDNHISAYPDSVNVLEGIENDVRTPDKLVDGINDTNDGRHMWLAPILPNMLNRVYVIFDTPMEVSLIKLWNYSKTGNRGVKDFALLVDDLLVYNGILEMVTPNKGILPSVEMPQKYHTIPFTEDKNIRQREKHTVIKNKAGEQDVQLMNDRKVVATYNDPNKKKSGKPVDQALRPTTSVPGAGKHKRR